MQLRHPVPNLCKIHRFEPEDEPICTFYVDILHTMYLVHRKVAPFLTANMLQHGENRPSGNSDTAN